MKNTVPADNTNANAIDPDISDENVEIAPHCTEDVPGPSAESPELEGLNDNHVWSNVSVEQKLPIPDSGWSWVVVLSAIFVLTCAHGLSSSFGQLYRKLATYFHTSLSEVYLIENLSMTASLFAGPITGALVDHYGCRIMTVFAGILATCALLLGAVSNSIGMICLTLGFLKGLAIGILYVTAIVSVVFWFEKRRNLAVSLVYSGIRFGGFIFSSITPYILEYYDWRNTIVLLSGILLNVCVCGMLMRNPKWVEIKRKRERELSKTSSNRSSSGGPILLRSLNGEAGSLDVEELKALLQSGRSSECILAALSSSIEGSAELGTNTPINADQTRKMPSAIRSSTFKQEKIPAEVIEKLMENKRIYNIIMHKYPDLLSEANTTCSHHHQRTKSTICVKILKFNMSYFIFTMWSLTPYYFLHSYMASRDTEGADTMNKIINITLNIGVIALGWAADQPWINVKKTYASCLVLCGLSVAAYPLFITSYWALAVVSAIFGISSASSYSFTPAMLLRLMPIDDFPTAYGLLMLFKGIGYSLGPSLSALMHTLTNGWGLCFCMSGLCLVVSGVCMAGIVFTEDQRTCGTAPLHNSRSTRPVEV